MMELHSKHRGVATILGVNVSWLGFLPIDRRKADNTGQEGDGDSVWMYRPRPRFAASPPLR